MYDQNLRFADTFEEMRTIKALLTIQFQNSTIERDYERIFNIDKNETFRTVENLIQEFLSQSPSSGNVPTNIVDSVKQTPKENKNFGLETNKIKDNSTQTTIIQKNPITKEERLKIQEIEEKQPKELLQEKYSKLNTDKTRSQLENEVAKEISVNEIEDASSMERNLNNRHNTSVNEQEKTTLNRKECEPVTSLPIIIQFTKLNSNLNEAMSLIEKVKNGEIEQNISYEKIKDIAQPKSQTKESETKLDIETQVTAKCSEHIEISSGKLSDNGFQGLKEKRNSGNASELEIEKETTTTQSKTSVPISHKSLEISRSIEKILKWKRKKQLSGHESEMSSCTEEGTKVDDKSKTSTPVITKSLELNKSISKISAFESIKNKEIDASKVGDGSSTKREENKKRKSLNDINIGQSTETEEDIDIKTKQLKVSKNIEKVCPIKSAVDTEKRRKHFGQESEVETSYTEEETTLTNPKTSTLNISPETSKEGETGILSTEEGTKVAETKISTPMISKSLESPKEVIASKVANQSYTKVGQNIENKKSLNDRNIELCTETEEEIDLKTKQSKVSKTIEVVDSVKSAVDMEKRRKKIEQESKVETPCTEEEITLTNAKTIIPILSKSLETSTEKEIMNKGTNTIIKLIQKNSKLTEKILSLENNVESKEVPSIKVYYESSTKKSERKMRMSCSEGNRKVGGLKETVQEMDSSKLDEVNSVKTSEMKKRRRSVNENEISISCSEEDTNISESETKKSAKVKRKNSDLKATLEENLIKTIRGNDIEKNCTANDIKDKEIESSKADEDNSTKKKKRMRRSINENETGTSCTEEDTNMSEPKIMKSVKTKLKTSEAKKTFEENLVKGIRVKNIKKNCTAKKIEGKEIESSKADENNSTKNKKRTRSVNENETDTSCSEEDRSLSELKTKTRAIVKRKNSELRKTVKENLIKRIRAKNVGNNCTAKNMKDKKVEFTKADEDTSTKRIRRIILNESENETSCSEEETIIEHKIDKKPKIKGSNVNKSVEKIGPLDKINGSRVNSSNLLNKNKIHTSSQIIATSTPININRKNSEINTFFKTNCTLIKHAVNKGKVSDKVDRNYEGKNEKNQNKRKNSIEFVYSTEDEKEEIKLIESTKKLRKKSKLSGSVESIKTSVKVRRTKLIQPEVMSWIRSKYKTLELNKSIEMSASSSENNEVNCNKREEVRNCEKRKEKGKSLNKNGIQISKAQMINPEILSSLKLNKNNFVLDKNIEVSNDGDNYCDKGKGKMKRKTSLNKSIIKKSDKKEMKTPETFDKKKLEVNNKSGTELQHRLKNMAIKQTKSNYIKNYSCKERMQGKRFLNEDEVENSDNDEDERNPELSMPVTRQISEVHERFELSDVRNNEERNVSKKEGNRNDNSNEIVKKYRQSMKKSFIRMNFDNYIKNIKDKSVSRNENSEVGESSQNSSTNDKSKENSRLILKRNNSLRNLINKERKKLLNLDDLSNNDINEISLNNAIKKYQRKQSLIITRRLSDEDILYDESNDDDNYDSNSDIDPHELTQDDIEKLTNLCVIPFGVPPLLHKVSTALYMSLSTQQQEQIQELDINVESGHYTTEEDEIIRNNWRRFCEEHDFDPEKPWLFFNLKSGIRGIIPKSESIEFVRCLAYGLEQRTLSSVFKRFLRLYDKKSKTGRFSKTEDEIILKYIKNTKTTRPFTELSEILNRHHVLIEHRYIRLTKSHDANINWTMEMMEQFHKNLLKVTKTNNVKDLIKTNITDEHWKKLSVLMKNMPYQKLKSVWYKTIQSFLYADKNLVQIKMKLIKILHERKENDLRTIKWNEIANHFPELSPSAVNKKFLYLLYYHVPPVLRKNLNDCLNYLVHIALPIIYLDSEFKDNAIFENGK